MRRGSTWFFILLIFFIIRINIFAQEEDDQLDEYPIMESEWGDYETNLYSQGDKIFSMTLGLIFPAVFRGDGIENSSINSKLGGTGTLAFTYFLNSNVFFGGELSGMFSGTQGKNTLFIVPFGLRAGYQFIYRRFEFPVSLMVGAAQQIFLEYRYFGLILKPGASAF